MKKSLMICLLVVFVISLVITAFEYKRQLDLEKELVDMKSEISNMYKKFYDITEEITNLKLEEQTLEVEKKKQIEQYEKWLRHNQILEDLLN
ncbi:MAG: hypothetical protein GX247_00085 [Mollicutes bacterium]|jgi:cell division protein FtsL|nr:hypothetical protein [Mollicutes bacterium]